MKLLENSYVNKHSNELMANPLEKQSQGLL